MNYPDPVRTLIDQLARFPGIGPKTAERLALFVLECPDPERIAQAILEAQASIHPCARCFNYTDTDLCAVCGDASRDHGLICLVETPRDIIAVEKSGLFRGTYHVLGGKIAPLKGVGPDQLNIAALVERVRTEKPREIILATGADLEGETTALYLSGELKPYAVKVSRIAYGIPVGGSLDYADEMTLIKAIEGRSSVSPTL